MLLHTLWLLLTACAAVAAVLVLTADAAVDTNTAEQQVQRVLAQEAAVEQVIYELVAQGSDSRWMVAPRAEGRLTIGEQDVAVTVQRVDGLLDVATADEKMLASLISSRLGAAAAGVEQRLLAARANAGPRRFGSYAEMQARAQLSDSELSCLLPFLTLFSGRQQPDPRYADAALARALNLAPIDGQGSSVMDAPPSAAGSTFRIRAAPADVVQGGLSLRLEVTLTGSIRPNHLARSRMFLRGNYVNATC